MKVLALNGSPRMRNSSTYHMLAPLLEGMKDAGAETELIHIRQLDLSPCVGCYACWVRTPGTENLHRQAAASPPTVVNPASNGSRKDWTSCQEPQPGENAIGLRLWLSRI
jgi:hypothetical protein